MSAGGGVATGGLIACDERKSDSTSLVMSLAAVDDDALVDDDREVVRAR